jgi:hypothetical protein
MFVGKIGSLHKNCNFVTMKTECRQWLMGPALLGTL